MDANSVSSSSGDAISSLPDDLLIKILCLLPTKRAACTSILSKRWRNLFFQLPLESQHHLYIDDSDLLYPEEGKRERRHVQEAFRDFVDKTLSACNSVKKFTLKCQEDGRHLRRNGRWILKAFTRGVSDLDLCIHMPLHHDPPISFLPRMFFINKTLVKLTLGTGFCLGLAPMEEVSLPFLKSMIIDTVWFRDQDICDIMLENCPALEELCIHHIEVEDQDRGFAGTDNFSHQSITKLTILYDNDFQPRRFLSFDTPNLRYLNYSDYLTCRYLFCNFYHSLLEARLDLVLRRGERGDDEGQNSSVIFDYICNVETLHLSSSTVEVMYACLDYWRDHDGFPFFKNLSTLHFESHRKEGWNLLSNMIEKSPKLETLVLKGLSCISNSGVSIGENVVKVLEIQGYKGQRRELKQVKRFLWKMEFLEETKVLVSDEIDNQQQLIEDIIALPKPSSNFHVCIL